MKLHYSVFSAIITATLLLSCNNAQNTKNEAQTDSVPPVIEQNVEKIASDSLKTTADVDDTKALQDEHIAFIKQLYDDFFLAPSDKSWDDLMPYYRKHCSKQIIDAVQDNYDYDCESGDCYAWWIFRDESQDGGPVKLTITHDHDNWYNAKYVDTYPLNIKIRVEGTGDNLKITGLKNKAYNVNVE